MSILFLKKIIYLGVYMKRIELKVPYQEKDKAKELGARWNPEKKSWYIDEDSDASLFLPWLEHPTDISMKNAIQILVSNNKNDLDDLFVFNIEIADILYNIAIGVQKETGIYQSLDIARQAAMMLLSIDTKDMRYMDFNYDDFSTSYEFLMFSSLAKTIPECLKSSYHIKSQFEVKCGEKTYRVDFGIIDIDGNCVAAIECDGFSTHHSNNTCVDYDNNRIHCIENRLGVSVSRISNKKIIENPIECAKAIWNEIKSK